MHQLSSLHLARHAGCEHAILICIVRFGSSHEPMCIRLQGYIGNDGDNTPDMIPLLPRTVTCASNQALLPDQVAWHQIG